MSFILLPVDKIPVLVTKADVLAHFADMSIDMAMGLRAAAELVKLPPELIPASKRAYLEAWKAKLPAADLQIAAAKDAAKLLKEIVSEERILAARAAANQTDKEPSRG